MIGHQCDCVAVAANRKPQGMSYFTPVYEFLHSKAGLALFITLLLIGLWNMFRAPAGNMSQRLMRWRVGLQFGAIVLIALVLYFKR